MPSLDKINALPFQKWVDEYNKAGLSIHSKPDDIIISEANTCNAIVCSALPRSIESVKLITDKDITLSSSLFNEADLPVANWKKLKLSPKTWAIIFRAMWLFGYLGIQMVLNHINSAKKDLIKALKSLKRLQTHIKMYYSLDMVFTTES